MEDSRRTKATILAGIIALVVFAPFLALANPPVGAGCGPSIGQAEFKASFEWKDSAAKGRPMEIRIGQTKSAPTPVAQILEKGRCVAVCRIHEPAGAPSPADPASFKGGPSRSVASVIFPNAIDMDCQSPALIGLASPAALIFHAQAEEPAVLRFGSWLSGYREAALSVKVDRLARAN